MNKLLIAVLLVNGFISAQDNFTSKKITGEVKILDGNSEVWTEINENQIIKNDAVILTGKNSSVQLAGNNLSFNLKEESAVTVSDIKKMNMDELLLALAVEEILDAPQKNREGKSESTAVYGSDEKEKKNAEINSDNFGFKRLKGAVQLSENGMKESAVVVAREVYRKYPVTKTDADLRIYFADILYNKGLYEEAMSEYEDILKLNLTNQQEQLVQKKLSSIKQKLLNN